MKHFVKYAVFGALALGTLALTSCASLLVTNVTESTTETKQHVHSFGEWKTVTEQSCTEDGYHVRECECGEKQEQVFNAAHGYCEWMVIRPATWESDGERAYVCRRCGVKLQTEVVLAGTQYMEFKPTEDGEGMILSHGGDYYTNQTITLPSVYEGKPVVEIGEDAFALTELKGVVVPEGVMTIGTLAFGQCLYLENIQLPNTLEIIGVYAFANCRMKEIVLPEGVKRIEDRAFESCSFMKKITIPKSLTYVGALAITSCYGLEEIYYEGTVEQWNAIEKHPNWHFEAPFGLKVICTEGEFVLEPWRAES